MNEEMRLLLEELLEMEARTERKATLRLSPAINPKANHVETEVNLHAAM